MTPYPGPAPAGHYLSDTDINLCKDKTYFSNQLGLKKIKQLFTESPKSEWVEGSCEPI